MKKIFFALISILLSSAGQCQDISESQKLETWCKIWGLLKYKHPGVNNTNINWDSVFIAEKPIILSFNNTHSLSKYFIGLIKNLSIGYENLSSFPTGDSECNFNAGPSLLNDTNKIDLELIGKLHDIYHIHTTRNRYVRLLKRNNMPEFVNENVYPNMVFPTKDYRLLTLARYWNVIEYFYPYKYKTDIKWDSVLEYFVPKFNESSDTSEYMRLLQMLIAHTNDSHSRLHNNASNSLKTAYSRSSYSLPVKLRMIDKSIVVEDILTMHDTDSSGLKIGDIIVSLSDVNIHDLINSTTKYLSSSNTRSQYRDVCKILTFGSKENVDIEIIRLGKSLTISQKRYPFNEISIYFAHKIVAYKKISNNIGYVDMGLLKNSDINKMFRSFKNTNGIIFDLRNYPNLTLYPLLKKLSGQERAFAKFTYPDLAKPGHFVCGQPKVCGKKSNKYYKGEIIALIDEKTQSQAEFTAMALKSIPKTILVGTRSSGTDGDVTTIPLHGGFFVKMTSLGVYYPNGQETQRVGIIPDIVVEQSIESILDEKDAALERSIQHINSLSNVPKEHRINYR